MAEGEQDCSVAMLVARAASGSNKRRGQKRAISCALCIQGLPVPTARKGLLSVHSISVLFVLKAKLREDARAGAVPLAVPFVAMSCNSKHIGDGLEYFPF